MTNRTKLALFWQLAKSHDDAHWGEAFQAQPMQESLHTKRKHCKKYQGSHDLDSDLLLKYINHKNYNI